MSADIVISISGHGGAGKDEFAQMLAKEAGLRYLESTSEIIKEVWWAQIQAGHWSRHRTAEHAWKLVVMGLDGIFIEPDEYPNIEAFYADRRNRREEWKQYIGRYNTHYDPEDGIATYKQTVARGNQFLCGIRQRREFLTCRMKLVDLTVWIDRPGIPKDPTQEYESSLCQFLIRNNGSLEDLQVQACSFATSVVKPYMERKL